MIITSLLTLAATAAQVVPIGGNRYFVMPDDDADPAHIYNATTGVSTDCQSDDLVGLGEVTLTPNGKLAVVNAGEIQADLGVIHILDASQAACDAYVPNIPIPLGLEGVVNISAGQPIVLTTAGGLIRGDGEYGYFTYDPSTSTLIEYPNQ